MWFEDFNIYLHHLQPQKPVGVAPGRHRVMRDHYLAQRRRHEEKRQGYARPRLWGRLTVWIVSEARRLRRPLAGMAAVKKWRMSSANS